MAYMTFPYEININDVTPTGQASNKAILRFFETSACKHSDKAGYGFNDMQQTRITWVIIAWKVQILSRPCYGDKINVITWSRGVNKFATYRDFKMTNEKGEVIAIASTKWALINIDKGLSRVTDEIISAYTSETESVFNEEEIKRLHEPTSEPVSQIEIVPTRRDIDINHHVHNLNYLDFANEALSEDVSEEPNNVEILYKNESKQGDSLIVKRFIEDGINTVTIKKADDSLCSIVKLY